MYNSVVAKEKQGINSRNELLYVNWYHQTQPNPPSTQIPNPKKQKETATIPHNIHISIFPSYISTPYSAPAQASAQPPQQP